MTKVPFTIRILIFVIVASIWTDTTAALPAEAFGTLPRIHDTAISPDGRQIAAIVNFDGTYGVRVITIGGQEEELRAILLGEGVKPQWIRWANDERILVSLWQSKIYSGVPISMSFIYTLDSSKMQGEILIEPRDILRQNNSKVIDFLDHDPDHILMAFSDADQFLADIQRVNINTGRYRRVKRGRGGIQHWYTDRRSEPRVGQGLTDRKTEEDAWNLIIRDADGDTWRDSDKYPGLTPDTRIFGFTSDPNELIIGHWAERQTLGVYVYDLGEKKITRRLFHHDSYDARGLVVDSDGDIIGAQYVADTTETEMLGDYDTVLNRMRERFVGYTVDYIDQSETTGRILFKVSSAYDPGALAIVDAATDEVKILAHYQPELPSAELGMVSEVTYTARDGFKIPAYITLPPSITDSSQIRMLPFVVLPHGGPYARTSKRFDYFAQFFASRGFGVLQMNFRGSAGFEGARCNDARSIGSAGYGKDFEDAGRENWVLMLDDIEDSTRWLIKNKLADPDRICIVGWSYGGYAALMGAIKSPELYACAASMAGVTDLKDMIRDIKKYRFGSIAAHNFILKGLDTREDIKENSPVKRAEEITAPLFLAHGQHDESVHFDQYKRMKSALKKSPADVTFMEFEDEDHYLSNQANRQRFFVGLDEFLRSTVGLSEFAK